jgi:hypothetical protein
MLFRDTQNLKELGRAVWVALAEVWAFYHAAGLSPSHRRFVYDARRPGDPLRPELPDAPELLAEGPDSGLWRSLRTRHSRTYDQSRMTALVRDALGPHSGGSRLLILTDQQIVPPEDWRYILWDGVGPDVVVSTAAMDPTYWGLHERHRVARVKHRARAAALSGSGGQLGLMRCDNPRCFLYADVDSVEVLDSMLLLGPEHRLAAVSDRGFSWPMQDPSIVQTVVPHPEPGPQRDRDA